MPRYANGHHIRYYHNAGRAIVVHRRDTANICWEGHHAPAVMIIQKLDFTYDGVPHSLQFRRIADGGKKPGTNVIYVYSPGLGLVKTEGE